MHTRSFGSPFKHTPQEQQFLETCPWGVELSMNILPGAPKWISACVQRLCSRERARHTKSSLALTRARWGVRGNPNAAEGPLNSSFLDLHRKLLHPPAFTIRQAEAASLWLLPLITGGPRSSASAVCGVGSAWAGCLTRFFFLPREQVKQRALAGGAAAALSCVNFQRQRITRQPNKQMWDSLRSCFLWPVS